MRELFNVIPAELFRPLAAPGAPVYAGVLFALFAATKRHHQPLSRELAVNLIADLLAEPDAMSATDDVEEAADIADVEDEADRIQARSGAVLRALVRYGWLRIETQSDFTQYYILPDYAFRLLETLERIAANEPIPLRGLIYSIYSMLQTAVSEGNEYIGISEASRQSAGFPAHPPDRRVCREMAAPGRRTGCRHAEVRGRTARQPAHRGAPGRRETRSPARHHRGAGRSAAPAPTPRGIHCAHGPAARGRGGTPYPAPH